VATTLETYNRGALIAAVLEDRVDWHPTQDQTFLAKVRRALNRRLLRMVREAPVAIWEREQWAIWQPDYTTGTVSVLAADTYVWVAGGAAAWNTSGRWDGRWIEVYQSDGTRYEYRIMEVFIDLASGTTRLTTDRAHVNATDIGLRYRIFDKGLRCPPEMVEANSIIPWSERWGPVAIGTPTAVEAAGRYDWQGGYTGTTPTVAWRQFVDKIQAPTTAPTVATIENSNWIGPEPAGTFKFIFCYIWGRDDQANDAPPHTGAYRPMLESGPSPESASIIVANGAGSNVIRITTPEIEWMTGYNVAGTARQGHGGIRKRIWVARSAVTTSGATHPQIETPEVYMHLVDIAGDVINYDWDGSVSPNWFLRHRTSHGRLLIGLDPRPSERLEFKLRGTERPSPLLHDQDNVELPPEACDVLLDGVAADVWKMIGDAEAARSAEKNYEKGLAQLSGLYETRSPATRIVRQPPQPQPERSGPLMRGWITPSGS
jgi:hypothetical protein